jgi:hypothetical protein
MNRITFWWYGFSFLRKTNRSYKQTLAIEYVRLFCAKQKKE